MFLFFFQYSCLSRQSRIGLPQGVCPRYATELVAQIKTISNYQDVRKNPNILKITRTKACVNLFAEIFDFAAKRVLERVQTLFCTAYSPVGAGLLAGGAFFIWFSALPTSSILLTVGFFGCGIKSIAEGF